MAPAACAGIDNLNDRSFSNQRCHVPAPWRELFAVAARGCADNLSADSKVDALHAWSISTSNEKVDPLLGDGKGGRG
jgi:hypothetical protein